MTVGSMHKVSAGRRFARVGFTLVELLVVIAILGILVGLLAWGVNAARISILKSAQAFEVQSVAAAVEAYRNTGTILPMVALGPSWKPTCEKPFPISLPVS
jgi:prepilin-type N-terminal cleavage/methylation domain-containing protein